MISRAQSAFHTTMSAAARISRRDDSGIRYSWEARRMAARTFLAMC